MFDWLKKLRIAKPFQISSLTDLFVVIIVFSRILPEYRFNLPVSIIGLLTLAYPQLFFAFVGINLYYFYKVYPDLGINFLILQILFSIIILHFFLNFKKYDFKKYWTTWLNELAPLLRSTLLIVYFFAALSKLNTTYLNVELSCATNFYKKITTMLGVSVTDLPQIFMSLSIWSSLIIEFLLFFILLNKKTRKLGVLIGVPFHLVLACGGHFRLSNTIFALYLLFLPSQIYTQVIKEKLIKYISLFIFISIVLIDYVGDPLVNYIILDDEPTNWIVFALFNVISFAVWYAVIKNLVKTPIIEKNYTNLKKSKNYFHVAVIAFLILYCLLPYANIKTAGVFTMFSNLRTEQGHANHLFMPTFNFSPSQERVLVHNLYIENENLLPSTLRALFRMKNYELPVIELKRIVRLIKIRNYKKDVTIDYIYNNKRYLTNLLNDPLFEITETGLFNNYLSFKAIPQRNNCKW